MKVKQPEEFVRFGRCRCCHNEELLNDDGRCSPCVEVGVTEEWEVKDDEGDDGIGYLIPA